jgi:signal peptidase II
MVSPWWAIGLGMILGGAMGNLVDRFFRSPGPLQGHVVDFLSIGWWPVFNVDDPSVVGGAILLVTLSAMGYDFDTVGRRRAGDDAERSDAEERRLVKADDAIDVADATEDTQTSDEPAEAVDGDEPQDGTVGRSTADQR